MRIRGTHIRLTSELDERHPFAMSAVRLAAGLWLVFLFAALVSDGDWWGIALLLPAALLLAVGAYVLVVFSPRRARRA